MNNYSFDILNYLPNEVYVCDANYEVIFVNKALTELIGENVIGKKCYSAICGKLIPCDCCTTSNSINENSPSINELQLINGNQLHNAKRVLLDEGKKLTILTDLTEIQQLRNEFLKIKAEYDTVEKMAKLGHWELDILNDKLLWSDEIFQIFEIDQNNFTPTYEDFLKYIHPEDRAYVNEKYSTSLIDRKPYDIVHRLLLSDGKISYVREKCSTNFDENGKALYSFGLVWDITEQILNENKIKSSEEIFKKLIELMPQPILITDSNGNILNINQSFTQLYGYFGDEIIGKTPRMLNPGRTTYENLGYDKFNYDLLFKDLWNSIRDKNKGSWNGTVINKSKKNELMWVDLNITTLFDESEKIIYHIGQPVDITKFYEKESVTKLELFKTIAAMSEIRDNETGKHMKRVGISAKLIAKQLGMKQKYCEDIENFAPMHDIGKLGIPDTILNAPRKLTEEEFTIMKQHTIIGNQLTKGTKELKMASEIALYHHERWNGTGYPHKLKGEKIPLHARITIVCDVYDALRSKRPYKDGWTHEKALLEIINNKGIMFDPKIVDAFLSIEKSIISLYQNF